jgi:hypothetical protein
VKHRRPEEIIGEWGIRDVTPPSAAERERLAGEHELNPFAGSALPRRIRRFGAQAHTYLASLGGPLPYMQRARRIDDLIERHNRWYPVEAQLPMDPRTKDYVKVGGRPYWRERLDAEWILAQFP